MKFCSKCKVQPSRNQKRGGYCTVCNNEYGRKNYQENKERYKNQARLRSNQLREIINEAKSKPCADCKNMFHPCQMDLDHKDPSKKEAEVSYMLRHKYAVEVIKAEIDKCVPVCACCHRLRHYNTTKRSTLTKIF